MYEYTIKIKFNSRHRFRNTANIQSWLRFFMRPAKNLALIDAKCRDSKSNEAIEFEDITDIGEKNAI